MEEMEDENFDDDICSCPPRNENGCFEIYVRIIDKGSTKSRSVLFTLVIKTTEVTLLKCANDLIGYIYKDAENYLEALAGCSRDYCIALPNNKFSNKKVEIEGKYIFILGTKTKIDEKFFEEYYGKVLTCLPKKSISTSAVSVISHVAATSVAAAATAPPSVFAVDATTSPAFTSTITSASPPLPLPYLSSPFAKPKTAFNFITSFPIFSWLKPSTDGWEETEMKEE